MVHEVVITYVQESNLVIGMILTIKLDECVYVLERVAKRVSSIVLAGYLRK